MKTLLALLFLITVPVFAQDNTPPGPPTTTSTTLPVSVDTKKVPPPDLTQQLDDLKSLNRVIEKLKSENGIDKLEVELNNNYATFLQAAAKDGFMYDPSKGVLTPIPPPPADKDKK